MASICAEANRATMPAMVVNPTTVVSPRKYCHSSRTNSSSAAVPTMKPR
jgi:hypothetical protein